MPALALVVIAPPLPDKSQVMTQTKRDNFVLPVLDWSERLITSPPYKNLIVQKPNNGRRMNYINKRPRKIYKDYMRFKGWPKKAMDREEWATVIKKAKAVRGPERQGISTKVTFLHIRNSYPLQFLYLCLIMSLW